MSLRRSIGRVVTPPLIAGILALHVDGCAGTVPGSSGIGNPRVDDGLVIQRVGIGATIEITRRDGVVMRGRFRGTVGMSPADYASHREDVLRSLDVDDREIPAPGDSVEIHPLSGPSYTATFASFELAGVEVEKDSALTTVPFGRIRDVHSGPWSRDRSELLRDAIAGRLPMSTSIRLGVGDQEVRVPVDRVAQVGQVGPAGQGTDSGDAAALGFLVGVGAVVLLIVLAAHDAGHSSCSGPSLPPCYPFCTS